jgi:hypothetical protein
VKRAKPVEVRSMEGLGIWYELRRLLLISFAEEPLKDGLVILVFLHLIDVKRVVADVK